jgi:peptide subunit release factor 1 (eRF1)
VISVAKIPFEAPPHEVADLIRQTAYTAERDHELILVQDTINMAKAGKRAALGLSDVNQALELYAVSLLILPYPIETPILTGIVDEMLVKALYSGSQIEFVRGEAADLLIAEGGVAAQLYYAI